MVEVKDETGDAVQVGRAGRRDPAAAGLLPAPPRRRRTRRRARPRRSARRRARHDADPRRPRRRARRTTPFVLAGTAPSDATLELLEQMGGKRGPGNTLELRMRACRVGDDLDARRDGLGRSLNGETGKTALGLPASRPAESDESGGAVAVYVVSEAGPIAARGPAGAHLAGGHRGAGGKVRAKRLSPTARRLHRGRDSRARTGSRSTARARAGRWCSR